MDIQKLKTLLKSIDISVAYHSFGEGQAPNLPYIVYYVDEDVGFVADDYIYYESLGITIEVYSRIKDLELESKIKKLLNDNQLPYESYESFLDSENMFLKAYEINI